MKLLDRTVVYERPPDQKELSVDKTPYEDAIQHNTSRRLPVGERKRGRPRVRYKNAIKKSLTQRNGKLKS